MIDSINNLGSHNVGISVDILRMDVMVCEVFSNLKENSVCLLLINAC